MDSRSKLSEHESKLEKHLKLKMNHLKEIDQKISKFEDWNSVMRNKFDKFIEKQKMHESRGFTSLNENSSQEELSQQHVSTIEIP